MSDTLFITGATSGFGEACARRFAEAGWKLVLTGRRAERLNALVEELSKQTEVHGLVVDVRDRKGMEDAIASLPPSFTKLRGLINTRAWPWALILRPSAASTIGRPWSIPTSRGR